jgi:uncharacterized membrane-anchored protein
VTLSQRTLVKVPQILAIFWVVKVVTTALGESISDYAVYQYNPVVAVLVGAAAFCVALAGQFAARRYVAWVYWLAVAMVAVFGTMAADVLHVKFKVPYVVSTVAFSVVLACVFAVWHATERTLSIHTINTRRRELFYWATVLATFALGTAAGDMTAKTMKLGYAGSAALFFVLICVPLVAWRVFHLNAIVAFWFAYVVTRPLGASVADWLGKPAKAGGIGLGDGVTSAIFLGILLALVGYLGVTKVDVRRDPADVPSP